MQEGYEIIQPNGKKVYNMIVSDKESARLLVEGLRALGNLAFYRKVTRPLNKRLAYDII